MLTDDELVDAVAAAIMAFEYSAEDYPYALTDEAEKNQYRGMARAAIAVVNNRWRLVPTP